MADDSSNDAKSASQLSADKKRLLLQRLNRTAKSTKSKPNGIPKRPLDQPALASLGQARIWVQDDLSGNSPGNNITSSFKLDSSVNSDALTYALNQVVARHEPLRSTYDLEDGEITQHTKPTLTLTLEHATCASTEAMFDDAQAFGRIPFDLNKGPLLRLGLFSSSQTSHVLILSIHDIIFDKWSLKLFWSEFSQFYRQSVSNIQATFPTLEIAYSDFSQWQRDWLKAGEQTRQTNYWKKKLSSPPPPISLPVDGTYSDVIPDQGNLVRAKLPQDLAETLRDFSAKNNASLFTTFLLGYNILLSKFANIDDLLVSSPVANRRKPETANLIGFFLNTLVLRSKFDSQTTIAEALNDTKDSVFEALEHQDLPTDVITKAVKPPRFPGRQPLFQTMFVFQREDEGTPKLELEDVSVSPIFVETKTSKFELSLFVAESNDTFETIVEYRTDLFEEKTIIRLLELYTSVLWEVVQAPNKRISEIELLPTDEAKKIRSFEKGKPLRSSQLTSILERIDQNATSATQAIITSSGQLDYPELDAKSNSIANSLSQAGAKKNQVVAVYQDRSIDMIVSIIGILKSGAPYLILETDYPDERVSTILEDAKVQFVIASPERSECSALKNCNVLNVKDCLNASTASIDTKPESDGLAYLIYTSGSSGKPKGVAVSHANLLASTEARLDFYGSIPQTFLLIPNLSFDSSVAGLFWTLSTGGTLVFPTAEEIRDPDKLCLLARANNVQATLCVPTLYTQLLSWDPASMASLRTAIVAGEACTQALLRKHQKELPDCTLFNEYGPTEATVWATVENLDNHKGHDETVSIGAPIPGVEVRILDNQKNRIGIGQIGELHIGGPTVTDGYLNQPELTERSFFPLGDHGKFYATGDLASWDKNGKLHYHGRNDDQIKIRGFRIETDEIRSALQSIPEVEDAVVVGAPQAVQMSLSELIDTLPPETIEKALNELTTTSELKSRIINRPDFQLELQAKTADFINPPRKAQRDWLVGQALNELAADLERLHEIAPSMVPGKDHKIDSDLIDITQTKLEHDEIMEDWQTPIMQAMANYVTENHGDVLEIGFGRGVSASFVQDAIVRSHTIIEMNRPCIENHFIPWRADRPDKKIEMVEGRWQDTLPKLGNFDGILFHAFPMNEQEFMDYVLNSITFAEHAFEDMANHLKPGGVFTYLTTEIDSLSRRHQRALFKHFSEVSFKVIPINVPQDTIDTWWANSMVAIKAIK
ncbi:amino acid adenylation domain-containing protein [Puniceicoccaceae bacterium K14]|nr:amino acid adenylation domain-containing protein [Puniceicoccaceae bacterium K14]